VRTWRCVGLLAGALAVVGVPSATAGAQAARPVVSIAATHAPFIVFGCGKVIETPGSFTLTRTGPVGDGLSVLAQVTVVANPAAPQSTLFDAFFDPGAQTVEMPLVVPSTTDGDTIDIQIVTDDAYDRGEPSTAHLVVLVGRAGCPTTTTTTVAPATTTLSTTTTVADPDATTSPSTAVKSSAVASVTTGVAAATAPATAAGSSSQLSAATLPRTGASDPVGLTIFALYLVAAGALLIGGYGRRNLLAA